MVLLLRLLNQKSIGLYNFRTIKVEATRTDTAYIETPASVFRVDMPKNDQSLEVDLTELVKGIPSVQLRNRENYAQDLQLSMRGFGARPTFEVRGILLYSDAIPATMPQCHNATMPQCHNATMPQCHNATMPD